MGLGLDFELRQSPVILGNALQLLCNHSNHLWACLALPSCLAFLLSEETIFPKLSRLGQEGHVNKSGAKKVRAKKVRAKKVRA